MGGDTEQLLLIWRKNLKAELKKRNVRLNDASVFVGKNAEYLSRVLQGRLNPTFETIIRICRNHDIPLSALFHSEMHGCGASLETGDMGDESIDIIRKIIRSPNEA